MINEITFFFLSSFFLIELGGSSREENKLVSPVCWYNSGVDVFQLAALQALFFSLYKKKSERSSSGNRRCASVKNEKKKEKNIFLFFLYPFCLAHNADNDECHTKHFKKRKSVTPHAWKMLYIFYKFICLVRIGA